MKSFSSWVITLLLVVLAALGGWQLGSHSNMRDMANMTTPMTSTTAERQPLYWVAPMDANYRRNEPGLSPMGMALIPVYESSDTISVSSAIQQNLGTRTEVVVRENFSPVIDAVGFTDWDQSSIQMLHTRAEGWLEVFNLASVGDRVKAGDIIYELFAPNLVSVQREFLTARDSGNRQLAAIARDRLLALGFTNGHIEELERTSSISNRLIVRAERDATITYIGVREGNYVEPQTALATLASLDQVWIETEVFESMAGWVQAGLPATVTFTAFPGETWNTEIAYIYPNLEATTRSLRLRLIVNNRDGRLRPNMFANVEISSNPRNQVLTVSREAVIRSGAGSRVIVESIPGQFRPQVVRTGVASGARIEILSGLTAGDRVVTSGQFLLDSEANGEQAFARLESAAATTSMPGMAMPMPTATTTAADTMTMSAADREPVYATVGEITRVQPETSLIIAHQPVAALDWPAMTMAFEIPSQMEAGRFAVGDRVAFEFVITQQGRYVLSSISLQDDTQ